MNENVLIIDETAVMRKMIYISLNAVGYEQITEADSATEAIYMLTHGLKPKIIIVNANISHSNGLALTKKIRELPRHRDVAILAITSNYGKSSTYTNCEKIGADALLKKPFTVKELYEGIDNVTHRMCAEEAPSTYTN